MLTDLYQEYLFTIGRLKDIHKLDMDVEHRNIHTFSVNKKPLFKLFYGAFAENAGDTIVVSFHIDLIHAEAIQWFLIIEKIYPMLQIHDSYIEDSNGETYLGNDAITIKDVYLTQEILTEWLEAADKEEIQEYVQKPVVGRLKDSKQSYDSRSQQVEAIIEFDRMRKPETTEDTH